MKYPTAQQELYWYHWKRTGFDPDRRRECADVAGYSNNTAIAQIEKTPLIRRRVEKAMERSNLTPVRVCEKLSDLLDCTDRDDNPDNGNQLKAVEIVNKLGNYYPTPKLEIDKREQSVKLDITTIRLAEELSGEKILDAEVVEQAEIEEPERASLGAGSDDSL